MRRFLRLLRYARPYRLRMAVGVACVVTVAVSNLAMPQVIRFIIDTVLDKDVIKHHRLISVHIGPLSAHATSARWLLILFFTICALYIARGALSYWRTYLMSWVGHRLLFDIRHQVFQRLQELPMQFYESRGAGQIIARLTGDVDVVGGMITSSSIDLFTNVVMVAGIVAYLLNKNWKLALISFIVLPLFAANYHLFIRIIQNIWRKLREKWSQLYGEMYESIAGAKVVKAFTQERYETRQFFRSMRETYSHSVVLSRVGTLMGSFSELLSALGTAVILFYGGLAVISGQMTVGELIVFYSYLGYLYGPIVTLSTTSDIIQRALISADRVFEIVDAKSTVEEAPDAYALPTISGRVVFENVSFSYEPEKPVLHDVSLEAPEGSVVALVGPSGSGKTTLANLIPRFYDPTSGRVAVDGHDIRKVTLRSLRSQIGVVLQETFLFSGTIGDNLRYGQRDATDEQIVEAAMMANAHDFIVEELPEGYETEVGDRGVRLSGGQRQRIAIARAILRDPRILILDEATSSLDSEAEALIQQALERLMRNRTTFVIAHRLSTVMKADMIVVLDGGRMVELGTHDELATAGGLYSRLYRKQFKLDEPARATF